MDCFDFVQGLHSFEVCFLRFLRWCYFYSMRKSKKKTPLFSIDCDLKMQGMAFRDTYPKFFRGTACHRTSLEVHSCGDHRHSYAGPKTIFFVVVRTVESLKLTFLKFNVKFNSATLWIIQLQTHQEHLQLHQGWGISAISCPGWWGICRFLRAIKTNPRLYPGVGWVGVYFDWCIIGKDEAFVKAKASRQRKAITALTCMASIT